MYIYIYLDCDDEHDNRDGSDDGAVCDYLQKKCEHELSINFLSLSEMC